MLGLDFSRGFAVPICRLLSYYNSCLVATRGNPSVSFRGKLVMSKAVYLICSVQRYVNLLTYANYFHYFYHFNLVECLQNFTGLSVLYSQLL